MSSVNCCFFIGNLTRDPEVRYTPKGTAVAEIGLAVNKVWRDEGGTKHEEVTFLNLVAWSKTAEIAKEYLKKGDSVHFQCEARMESWEDKTTHAKRTAIKFTVQQLTLLNNNRRETEREEPPPSTGRMREVAKKPPAKQPVFSDPDLDPRDEERSPFD